MPDAEAAITQMREAFPRINRKELVNAAIEWLGTASEDVQGAILSQLPAARRPDFARLILEQLAGSSDARSDYPRLAAKPAPPTTGKKPPRS